LETVVQTLVAGLLIGGIYALISVGLALIFGIMRVVNFAQGEFMMLGMYFVFYMFTAWGIFAVFGVVLGPILAALAAGPVLFALGWFIHRLIIGRVSGSRRGGHDAQLLVTLGISLILQNLGLIVFGATPVAVLTPLSSQALAVGPILINEARAVACVLAIVLTILLTLFLNRTRQGKQLRAAADSPEAATYVGIDVSRAHALAFSIGIALTAIAGGLVATYYPLQPYVGQDFVIIMFVAVVLGGLGSISGAFWGGLILGLVQQLANLVIDPQLQNVVIFVLFLLVLYVRPQGLLGRLSIRV
jgi:branched-chain amino acid transport system permease protein